MSLTWAYVFLRRVTAPQPRNDYNSEADLLVAQARCLADPDLVPLEGFLRQRRGQVDVPGLGTPLRFQAPDHLHKYPAGLRASSHPDLLVRYGSSPRA